MKKNILLFFGAMLLIALLLVPGLAFINKTTIDELSLSDLSPLETRTSFAPEKIDKTTEQIEHSGLPIGEIEKFASDKSWGTVYLIPQNHRYPGTSIADSKNDSAEIAQNQIYEIIKFLHDENGIDFMMAEGELYGEVSEEKIWELKEKIALRQEFAEKANEFKEDLQTNSVDKDDEEQFFEQADNFIALLDREIALQGAPLRIAADEADVQLYGSENQDTRDECATIVRNYIYQKDQLQTCEGGLATAGGANTAILEKLKALKKLDGTMELSEFFLLDDLIQNTGSKNPDALSDPSILEKLKTLSSGNNNTGAASLAERIAELKKQYSNKGAEQTGDSNSVLQSLLGGKTGLDSSLDKNISGLMKKAKEQKKTGIVTRLEEINKVYEKIKDKQNTPPAEAAGPSRSDNPYKAITNPDSLKELIKESEENIQEVVIDQRNEETAENFKNALVENKKTAGILQFGAGHEEGLIKELQKQGLSVIVVKPNEVLRRESN